MSSKGTLFVLSGPSGVGKGTLCNEIMKEKDSLALTVSISATTRKPRNIDKEGETYYFKTTEEFEAMIRDGAFLEWATYNENYYGTPLAPVLEKLEHGMNVILEIDVQGALQVKKNFPSGVCIFIAPPDMETLCKRLRGRGTETESEIVKRIAAAQWEMQQQDHYDYVVVNQNLDDAVTEIKDIIRIRSVVL